MNYRTHIGKRTRNGFDPFYTIVSWLLNRSPWEAWALVVGGVAIITFIDLLPGNGDISVRSLYVFPVILGCWMLGRMHAITVTAFVVLAMSIKAPLVQGHVDLLPIVTSTLARAVSFAAVAGIVAGFRSRYNHVLNMAQKDRMTGVLNKTAFEEEVKAMLAAGHASGKTVLLAVMDLDGFKSVNDQHGHETGDEVLMTFTHHVAKEIRRADRFGRIGGDEFALALQAASPEEARLLATRLHRRVTEALAGTCHSVTCSMGALIVPPEPRRASRDMMREADRLMYAVKRGGKNAVVVAEAEALPGDGHTGDLHDIQPVAAGFP
ncbi:conserved membrane hypothetical protein [uncultured Pleomorphomonas sp.]|uniref:diguanylate cyclase n=1 Tax=uncultured Pleomorphomonas sp. TaxID=442121 RepID=A0A212LFM4_9HYPH|nr:GGDEF domain-containing protein [uncultured Pleomorphomonas sp.]SCM76267.1 conserved membrane hypothetical protein [uncultured Pleomorphomonas sp.]